jgi:hypothetical protein
VRFRLREFEDDRAEPRYAFFLRPTFRLAVLRAVFFAADFVFDFAFFAILPS